ncbi:MAG: hypothetical protein M1445_03540 [Bacteroidetes bacterium]|nr:hypothetical protein [Bacteroidota bacterium]
MSTVSIPPPYRFNPWKHHLHWVLDRLQYHQDNPEDLTRQGETIENIKAINSNYLDIYAGSLTPEQLIRDIGDKLRESGISDRCSLSGWIGRKGFKLVTLPDRSGWVLREGTEEGFYIHFHPARNTPQVIRIHGNSWKSVVVARMFNPGMADANLSAINEVRVKYLDLSPIKNIFESQRLLKALELLQTNHRRTMAEECPFGCQLK